MVDKMHVMFLLTMFCGSNANNTWIELLYHRVLCNINMNDELIYSHYI
jgi:hypothetical protein